MIAVFSISCLTAIALNTKIDSTSAIAAIAIGLAASNASQNVGEFFSSRKKKEPEVSSEPATDEEPAS